MAPGLRPSVIMRLAMQHARRPYQAVRRCAHEPQSGARAGKMRPGVWRAVVPPLHSAKRAPSIVCTCDSIHRFWASRKCLGGPDGHKSNLRRWGASPPTFGSGVGPAVPAPTWGRPDTPKSKISGRPQKYRLPNVCKGDLRVGLQGNVDGEAGASKTPQKSKIPGRPKNRV
jgi:hypothetical protein